jgi:hypothetical protein
MLGSSGRTRLAPRIVLFPSVSNLTARCRTTGAILFKGYSSNLVNDRMLLGRRVTFANKWYLLEGSHAFAVKPHARRDDLSV